MIRQDERAAALTALMRSHGVAVYRYCREELHDRTLADDVHQPRSTRVQPSRAWRPRTSP